MVREHGGRGEQGGRGDWARLSGGEGEPAREREEEMARELGEVSWEGEEAAGQRVERERGRWSCRRPCVRACEASRWSG